LSAGKLIGLVALAIGESEHIQHVARASDVALNLRRIKQR